MAAMEDILVVEPGIDYVFCHNDTMVFGALMAAEAVGREGIKFIGADGEQDAFDLILDKTSQFWATNVYPRTALEGVETLPCLRVRQSGP